jgi:hypothetical protein
MTTNLLGFANLWQLRSLHPKVPRPFLVPGGRAGLLLGLGSIFSGVVAYWVASVERRHQWEAVDPRRSPTRA